MASGDNPVTHTHIEVRVGQQLPEAPVRLNSDTDNAADYESARSSASKPFNFNDILLDPSLALAARHELTNGMPGPVGANASRSPSASYYEPGPLDHLSRMKETVELLDEDMQEESEVNCELSEIVLKQLEASKRELNSLASVLISLVAAESAYCTALTAPPKTTQRASHTPSIRATPSNGTASPAEDAFTALPLLLLPVHQQLHSLLLSLQQQASHLLGQYQQACKDVAAEAVGILGQLKAARERLHQRMNAHSEAMEVLEEVLAERSAGKPQTSPALDPWAVERQLVQALQSLQRCQDKERSFLNTAFSQAKDLEMQRVGVMEKAVAGLSEGFSVLCHQVLACVQQVTGSGGEAGQQACTSASARFEELNRAANTASEATSALAERQGDSIRAVNSQLFCSPEIIRQGDLHPWDSASSSWLPGHAVLTRAGFLYWFAKQADGAPGQVLGELGLAKLQFEAGQPPCFNLVQESSSSSWFMLGAQPKKLTFKAVSVEDCCEWAIAIREAIGVACGKLIN